MVAGDATGSLKAGVKAAEPIYTAEIEEYPGIVVASSHRADLNLLQAAKALIHAASMAEMGGTLILITPCPEGMAKRQILADAYGLALAIPEVMETPALGVVFLALYAPEVLRELKQIRSTIFSLGGSWGRLLQST